MNPSHPNPASDNGHKNRCRAWQEEIPPGQAFSEAISQFGELREYAAQYLASRADSVKLSVRKLVILAVLGVLGMLIGGAILVTAASIVVIGTAQLIAQALGGRIWAGNLIVGVATIALVGAGVWIMMRRLTGASRKATVERYERRLKQQRVVLEGHDAQQRSAEFDAVH